MPEYRTPIPALLAATMQSGLNAVLALDDDSSTRLARLQNRTLKLQLDGAGIDFYFTAGGHGIVVSLDPAAEPSDNGPDATISGTPAALFSMAAAELDEGWAAPGSKVSIAGDAGLARDFERLFSRLDPDIEGALSSLFGDVAGHQLAFGLKQGARRAREAAGEARTVLGEVLREGSRGGRSGPLIGSDEARQFSDDVDHLRDAVDRLEARLRMVTDSSKNEGKKPS